MKRDPRNPDPRDLRRAASIFKVLSHPDRLRLACLLSSGTPTTQKELIGARFNGDIEEVRVELGVDALYYMPEEVFVEHVIKSAPACMACTTGRRAVKFEHSGPVLPPA